MGEGPMGSMDRSALATPPAPAAPAGAGMVDWSYAFDSDTLRDRFGGSFMASEPDANGNVSVLLSQADAHAIIAALTASPAPDRDARIRELEEALARTEARENALRAGYDKIAGYAREISRTIDRGAIPSPEEQVVTGETER